MKIKPIYIYLIIFIFALGLFSIGIIPKIGGIFFGYNDFLIKDYNIKCDICYVCTDKTDFFCIGQIIKTYCCEIIIITSYNNDNISMCKNNIFTIYNKNYTDINIYLEYNYPFQDKIKQYYNRITKQCISENIEFLLKFIGVGMLIIISLYMIFFILLLLVPNTYKFTQILYKQYKQYKQQKNNDLNENTIIFDDCDEIIHTRNKEEII